MAKINYPTPEWIDRWVDNWMDAHPDERVSDFDELKAQAEDAWWLNEVEHDRPTPFDLTPEQEKVSHEARRDEVKGRERSADKPPRKPRTVKENPTKQKLIALLADALKEYPSAVVVKPEREISVEVDGVAYSITLIAHRAPKQGA